MNQVAQSATAGLTSLEASARLDADRPNELPHAGQRSVLRIVLGVVREPMLALLLAGGIAYLILGDLGEALVLLDFAMFSIAVTVVQEARTENVLEALRDLSAPRATVVRDGTRASIAGREVVAGDRLVLDPGDRIAADAVLVEASDLQTDESLLTGESLPVGKVAGSADCSDQAQRPGGDGQPFVYSGSLVVRGSGIAIVLATGPRSEIGRIGTSLTMLDTEVPRLRTETTRIVTWCAIGGGVVASLVVLLYGLLRGGWTEAALAGIAIGMSMVPEEFPVVLTVFLAMGAWRIGNVGVLTRRAAAIETLGSATVLCSDKTGTLTQNRMTVAELWLPSGLTADVASGASIPADFHAMLKIAVLASAVDPADPMEKLRIVEAFKSDGEMVAMTGDGVNDAPSLKAAHIGIAMGKRGTDVAREASAIVLLDDDFGSIVHSVRLGRRIYDNIRKAMAFIFAVHVPIAGLALLPLFLGLPILFGPVHIALLEMVIEPVCALVFEAERDEEDIMKRPPRDRDDSLFSLAMVAWSVFQGGIAFALLATVFLVEVQNGMPVAELRALMFFALVAEIVALILINRSFSSSLVDAFTRHNAALGYVIVAIVTITGAILFFASHSRRPQIWLDYMGRHVSGSRAWSGAIDRAGRMQALCPPCFFRARSSPIVI